MTTRFWRLKRKRSLHVYTVADCICLQVDSTLSCVDHITMHLGPFLLKIALFRLIWYFVPVKAKSNRPGFFFRSDGFKVPYVTLLEVILCVMGAL